VIAVNQDPLGKPARLVKEVNGIQIWLKQLLDGSVAVGLFNTGGYGTNPASYFNWGNETAASFNFDFSSIGLNGKYTVRDLWQQKNIGVFNGSMKTTINHHGVQMFQLTSKK
jgi:alpha-galactosidase